MQSGRVHGLRITVLALMFLLAASSKPVAKELTLGTVVINSFAGPISKFLPDETFGAALDGHERGEIGQIYTSDNVSKMRSSGLRKITYRLRTELGIEAWHWSEQGTWSDAEHQQGYWVSSDTQNQRVLISHGYRLPRRGNTIDQAEDDGYSRLTDGDTATFWKSNPYLDEHFTNDEHEARPQWLVIDFGTPQNINAAKILWGTPYAKAFEIEYWASDIQNFELSEDGEWRRFENGLISENDGASQILHLCNTAVHTRYVRILLHDSSGMGPEGAEDLRDSLGFAIKELYIGKVNPDGTFVDAIVHAPNNRTQTVTYVSSTDPWHRASDIDSNTEQPGFDMVFNSGLTNNLPVLVPVGLLYDTPENAAAEISFLKQRGYPVQQVEMGEEPDGQYVSPEHYAALYVEFARAIQAAKPELTFGGPSFQNGIIYTGFDVDPKRSWIARFLGYLRDHDRLEDYKFLSFEWYPFDDLCRPPSGQLMQQPERLARVFRELRQDGLPNSIPIIITEYGYSAFAGHPSVEMSSALMNADIVGQFLTLGGRTAYLYGYEPNRPIYDRSSCAGYGQLMVLEADGNLNARWPMPTYFAAQLITRDWAQPMNRLHELYAAKAYEINGNGSQVVSAYAVKRPDHRWAIMLVNKDSKYAHAVRVVFREGRSLQESFVGGIQVAQYSSRQYAWQDAGEKGHPIRSDPPHHFTLRGDGLIYLPPLSLTVARGKAPARSRFLGHHPKVALLPSPKGLSIHTFTNRVEHHRYRQVETRQIGVPRDL
jgi:hypothetical protein